MKRILLIASLLICTLSVAAQQKSDRFIQLTLAGEYKGIYYANGSAPSIGYTAGFDFVNGHLLAGIGFDNGIRNASMEQYNTFLFVKAGYVFEKGRFRFVPYLRTGWFMDVRKVKGNRNLFGYHQLLASAGANMTFLMSDWVFLTGSAEFAMTSLFGNGFSTSLGVIFPLYYFPKTNLNEHQ